MNQELRDKITRILKELGFPEVGFTVEHPAEESFGDFSTNVAMVLAKQVGRKPRELAEEIAEKLGVDPTSLKLRGVKVAGPGFINISINSEYFVSEIKRVLKNASNYGKGELWQGKKVAVEYTDPNPFKEFHIGHMYSNIIGESTAKLFEANGAEVWRGDFYGDVGLHVAKSVWGMISLMDEGKVTLEELKKKTLSERQKFLGKGYALGVNEFDENEAIKTEITELNKIIYVVAQELLKEKKNWKAVVDYRQFVEVSDERLAQVKEIYAAGLEWSLEYFETIYKRLGTKFDGYYPESWVGEYGVTLVQKGLEMGVLNKSEGAVVYEGEQDGLHTRVFLNKLGLPTYEAKDLGLAYAKYQDFKYDLSLNVFGKEIDDYYKVVAAALKKIEPELGAKARHLAHGMVNLPEGKMSSRKGNVITAEGLLEEIKERVRRVSKETGDDVIEMVAQGAVKYALLKSGVGKDVTFDLKESVSFEGNSGPYLQYTYARCKSVLRKAKESNHESQITNHEFNDEERAVLRWIPRYGEVVEKACKEYAPNHVCTYLFELAQRYNTFYNKHSILGRAQNAHVAGSTLPVVDATSYKLQATSQFRLALTGATAQVLQNGLGVLGINVPEKM